MSGKIHVAMSGLPGKMALAVAEAVCKYEDMQLMPVALTGKGMPESLTVSNSEVTLCGPDQRNKFMDEVQKCDHVIIVDYSHPNAVGANVEWFVEQKIPFVLGTTGGDYAHFERLIAESQLPCVIAPNMALPIVAITAMLKWASEEFPGVFSGYDLHVRESHQKGKADTSGTAKALIALIQKMGARFSDDQIELCRDPEEQKGTWGIPEEHLAGHAFHTYDIRGHEGTAHFSLQHNILGRNIYAEGTVEAIRFLSKRLSKPVEKSFNMIDVLKNLRG